MELVKLRINSRNYQLAVEKNWNLLYVLREVMDLTGTKCGCSTGDCGSCKVIIDGEAVNSCSVKASDLSGREIRTIEGLSPGRDGLHPIQQAFIDCGAVQCGFCIPGMVMTASALLDKNPAPTEEDIKEAMKGNLCRCTGYVKIIDAVRRSAEILRREGKQ